MRRQVKPFVTEYRGSPRRNKDLASGDLQPDMQPQRNRSFAEAERMFHAEASEDSYEAALRAADALFAPSRDDASRDRDRDDNHEPAAPLPRQSIAEPAVSDASASEPEVVDTSVEREATASPRRILQAIEPPTEDRFAALEAERAPKRRGRKPGSKNKPKIVVGDDWAAAARPTLSVDALPVATPAPRPALADALDPAPDCAASWPATTADTSLVDTSIADEETLPKPRGRTDRFGRKRASLRPGERWKRRLPKAAW